MAESELKHLLLVGEELEEGAGEESIEDARDEGNGEAHLQCDAHDEAEHTIPAPAYSFAYEGFGSVGQPVHEVGEECEELH